MNKTKIIALVALTLASVANVSAYTWTIANGLNKRVCVTLNVSGQKMRKDIEPGKEKPFKFGGWKSGLCLTSISVKKYKEGCPKGLANIGKASLFTLAKDEFNQLKTTATSAAKSIKAKDKSDLQQQITQALKASFGLISKLCKSRKFVLVEQNGKIYAAAPEK